MTHRAPPNAAVGGGSARLKRAETTSAIGAGVLGAGIALLFASVLKSYTVPILVLGLVMHSWGMYDKHRLEANAGAVRVWWVEALYWGCWVALVGLLVYVIATR